LFHGKAGNGSVEIGYGILPAYQNRGFMSEAIDGICRFAKEAGVNCITAETEIENAASQRVLMKNGFSISERRAETILFRKELGD